MADGIGLGMSTIVKDRHTGRGIELRGEAKSRDLHWPGFVIHVCYRSWFATASPIARTSVSVLKARHAKMDTRWLTATQKDGHRPGCPAIASSAATCIF